MHGNGWLILLALLLVPSSQALGLQVHEDVELPALPETGLELDLDTTNGVPRGAAELCAVGTCLATDGNRDGTNTAGRTHSTARTQAATQEEAGSGTGINALEVVAAGATLAAFLGLVAKWWLVGPGRVLTFIGGPLNLLFWGATRSVKLTPDLENPTRARILEYITAHPGASIQEVRRAMDIAWGTAVYHLQWLERSSQAVSCREGNRHRYWIAGTPEAGVRNAWMVLEQPTARRIARAVGSNPGIHQGGLCERLQMGGPTASKHLKRLVTRGLVEANRCSRYMLYSPTPRLTQAMTLWDTHHDLTSQSAPRP